MAQGVNHKSHIIDATILFIDLMGSVALSNSLSLYEYNALINDYQDTLRAAIDEIRSIYPVGEYYLGGDQLAVFFYDIEDASKREKANALRERNPRSAKAREILAELEFRKNRALYAALRCAVQVKNAWTSHARNVARVQAHQPVLDIGVGINTGNVILQARGDGRVRIEGYAINFAKRVEGFSRFGRFCKIMLSKTAYETFRNIVVRHAMLKQRAFFEAFEPQYGLLKGLAPGTLVYELKFFHRLAGFSIGEQHVDLYEQIYAIDPTNIWAYSNLLNFYLYEQNDIKRALQLAQRALYSNPGNEMIFYDLAKANLEMEEFESAREYCLRCLKLNDEMDIAFDLLADLEMRSSCDWNVILEFRAKALALSPGSAEYHLDFAIALTRLGRYAEACKHLSEAWRIFPDLHSKFRAEEVAELRTTLASHGIDPAAATSPCRQKVGTPRRKKTEVKSEGGSGKS